MTAKKQNSKATHESLIDAIVKAEADLQAAKEEYKAFCKDCPLELPKAPTLHEARMMREKIEQTTLADHQKANKLAADKVKEK